MNVENPYANDGIHCTGALVGNRYWILTTSDCGFYTTDNMLIKYADDEDNTPVAVSVTSKKDLGEVTLLKLSEELTRNPVQLSSLSEMQPCATWYCHYFMRMIPDPMQIPMSTVKLKHVSHRHQSVRPAECKRLFPHKEHLFCTIPDTNSGYAEEDRFIRAAALVDDKGRLAGLGLVNHAAIPGQTQGHNIFLPLDRYRNAIIATISEKEL